MKLFVLPAHKQCELHTRLKLDYFYYYFHCANTHIKQLNESETIQLYRNKKVLSIETASTVRNTFTENETNQSKKCELRFGPLIRMRTSDAMKTERNKIILSAGAMSGWMRTRDDESVSEWPTTDTDASHRMNKTKVNVIFFFVVADLDIFASINKSYAMEFLSRVCQETVELNFIFGYFQWRTFQVLSVRS